MICLHSIANVILSFVWLFKVTSSCNVTYTNKDGNTGTFASPNYPQPYKEDLVCMYMFQGTVDERINITFIEFDIRPGVQAGCLYDYIEIYAESNNKQLSYKQRLCGTKIPRPIISVTQRVELHFKTGLTGNFKGFKASYTFIDELWQPFEKSKPACGESYITGVGGILTSPGYPEPYPFPIECTWMIRVPDHMKINMNFLEIDMGQSLTCSDSDMHLSMYNGFADPDTTPAKELCGQLYFDEPNMKEFKGRTFRTVVRFVIMEENKLQSTGFRMAWTAVKIGGLPTAEHCPEFLCSGGQQCIPESKILCNKQKRYCIANSLTCNGIPNCGAYDYSDEKGCILRIVLITAGVLLPLFFAGFTVAFCHQQKKQRLRREQHEKAMAAEELNRRQSYLCGGVNNIYTSVPHNDVPMNSFDRSPSRRRYLDHHNHQNHINERVSQGHHTMSAAAPAIQYGVPTDSCCSDTELDYVSSSCSNYPSPASLRYMKTSASYRVVQVPVPEPNAQSVSATV